MSKRKIFAQPEGLFDRLVVVGPDEVYIANPARDLVEEIVYGESPREALDEGMAQAKLYPFATLKFAKGKASGSMVAIKCGKGKKALEHDISLRDAQMTRAFMQAMASNSGYGLTERRRGLIEGARAPGIATLFAIGFGAICWQAANAARSGETLDTYGRRKWLKEIAVWLGETLGTHASLAVGGLVVTLALGWLVMATVRRPTMLAVKPPEKQSKRG